MAELESFLTEFEQLDKQYLEIETLHDSYGRKVDEVKSMQAECMSGIAQQRKGFRSLMETYRRIDKQLDADDREKVRKMVKTIDERKTTFREMEDILPHENGLYLKIILGSVNVSLLSKRDKYKYKENYENFKVVVVGICFFLTLLLHILPYFRVLDAVCQFLFVWYYCTLTIRESILKVNGSRIKGWWMSHHFISTAGAGIILIWPEGYTYNQFRGQLVIFMLYINFVSVVQYYYQKGALYRLRALGERRNMDITVEGFQSWMWKNLTFVLPSLVAGYFFQLYNAYILYTLATHELCVEWQVPALCIIFLVIFLGNTVTVSSVIKNKVVKGVMPIVAKNKYRFENFFQTNSSGKVHKA